MTVPYIPEYPGEPFDFFDALGLVPKSTYTEHDIQSAWRKAFMILHSDRRHINGIFVPKFPTIDHITKAKDWLLEHPENIEIAHEELAEIYKSTWNPHAKAGTPAVLQPIPGAVADPLPRRPRQSFDDGYSYFDSDRSYSTTGASATSKPRKAHYTREAETTSPSATSTPRKGYHARETERSAQRSQRDDYNHRARQDRTGAHHPPPRSHHTRETERPASRSQKDYHNHLTRQDRSEVQNPPPRSHAKVPRTKDSKRDPNAQEIINDMYERNPGLEDFHRSNNVRLR